MICIVHVLNERKPITYYNQSFGETHIILMARNKKNNIVIITMRVVRYIHKTFVRNDIVRTDHTSMV